ncbi:MAG: hypothetical protein LBE81_09275 [Azonexus sp.]|uniref:hypothetical protein n=1 Tax=Azonexus sp. TaxID=1872668 RepID=UPI0028227ECE|nr:hypothetical protein [Azonexus sp.]MDR0776812.1 hypothetical protein [Azonexus sp.]
MEEIATALANPSSMELIDQLISTFQKLDSIARISRNFELLPAVSGPVILKEEHPLECFRRVVMHYDKNPIIEENERQMLASFKENDQGGKLASKMSNLPEDFLLDSEHGRNLKLKLHFNSDLPFICKAHGVKDLTWNEISGHFPVIERAVELAMNFLEQVRYRPEHISKSRSRMHDVTHCIYASACQQFVTNDKRLYDKAKAVYRYFGVPTRVLMLEEFIASDYD